MNLPRTASAVALLALVLAAAPPAAGARPFLVALDPAPSPDDVRCAGLVPRDLAREVAGLVAAELSRRREIATLTVGARHGERLTAAERGDLVRRRKADLYLRFLATAEKGPGGFGTRSPDAEGAHGGRRGPDLETRRRSRLVAVAVAKAMREAAGGRFPFLGARGESETPAGEAYGAPVEAIRAGVPTALVVLGSLGDPVDASFWRYAERRRSMARGIARGVIAWHDFVKRRGGATLDDELVEYYPVY